MKLRPRSLALLLVGALASASCSGEDGAAGAAGAEGPAGLSALVRTAPEPAGGNCSDGGTIIQTGLDDDGDGTLDDAEVDGTSYVCNGAPGADGLAALVRLVAEPAGEACPYGGTAILAGVDDDRDGALDDAEVDSTSYVCNGASASRDGILFLQRSMFPSDASTVTLVDRLDGAVWSVVLGDPRALAPNPDGRSFWVSTAADGIQRRSLATGALLDTVGFPSAGDMVVVPSLGRLYVGGYEQIGVVDLSTRALAGTIALATGDQTVGISASPDGGELLQGTFDGSSSSLVFVSTASGAVVQRLAVPGYAYDNLHLGDRVITWDDASDELRVYGGAPWAEDATQRVTIGADSGTSFNAFHNLRHDPAAGRVYLFRATVAELRAFDASDTTVNATIPTSDRYTCLLLDADGTGLLGSLYPPATEGLEHVALPDGTLSPSSIDTSGLGSFVVTDMWSVRY